MPRDDILPISVLSISTTDTVCCSLRVLERQKQVFEKQTKISPTKVPELHIACSVEIKAAIHQEVYDTEEKTLVFNTPPSSLHSLFYSET